MEGEAYVTQVLEELAQACTPTHYDCAVRLQLTMSVQHALQCSPAFGLVSGLNVVPFGSFISSFYNSSSDLDVAITGSVPSRSLPPAALREAFPYGTPAEPYVSLARLDKQSRARMLRDAADALLRAGVAAPGSVEYVLDARVPIVRFRDAASGVESDLCVGSPHAGFKAWSVARVSEVQPAFGRLFRVVKAWAHAHGINDGARNTLNSWCLALLVMFFLQRQGLLPPLYELLYDSPPGLAAPRLLQDGAEVDAQVYQAMHARAAFARERYASRPVPPLGQLFCSFLATGGAMLRSLLAADQALLPRHARVSVFYGALLEQRPFAKDYVLCVEDPYDAHDNPGRTFGTWFQDGQPQLQDGEASSIHYVASVFARTSSRLASLMAPAAASASAPTDAAPALVFTFGCELVLRLPAMAAALLGQDLFLYATASLRRAVPTAQLHGLLLERLEGRGSLVTYGAFVEQHSMRHRMTAAGARAQHDAGHGYQEQQQHRQLPLTERNAAAAAADLDAAAQCGAAPGVPRAAAAVAASTTVCGAPLQRAQQDKKKNTNKKTKQIERHATAAAVATTGLGTQNPVIAAPRTLDALWLQWQHPAPIAATAAAPPATAAPAPPVPVRCPLDGCDASVEGGGEKELLVALAVHVQCEHREACFRSIRGLWFWCCPLCKSLHYRSSDRLADHMIKRHVQARPPLAPQQQQRQGSAASPHTAGGEPCEGGHRSSAAPGGGDGGRGEGRGEGGAQAAPSGAAWEHSVVTTAVQQRLQSPELPDAGAAAAAGPSTHAGVRACPLQGPSGGGACGGSPHDAEATGGSGDGGSEGRGTRAEAEPSCAACEDSADATAVQQPRSSPELSDAGAAPAATAAAAATSVHAGMHVALQLGTSGGEAREAGQHDAAAPSGGGGGRGEGSGEDAEAMPPFDAGGASHDGSPATHTTCRAGAHTAPGHGNRTPSTQPGVEPPQPLRLSRRQRQSEQREERERLAQLTSSPKGQAGDAVIVRCPLGCRALLGGVEQQLLVAVALHVEREHGHACTCPGKGGPRWRCPKCPRFRPTSNIQLAWHLVRAHSKLRQLSVPEQHPVNAAQAAVSAVQPAAAAAAAVAAAPPGSVLCPLGGCGAVAAGGGQEVEAALAAHVECEHGQACTRTDSRGERPWTCPLCTRCYFDSSEKLAAHMIKRHVQARPPLAPQQQQQLQGNAASPHTAGGEPCEGGHRSSAAPGGGDGGRGEGRGREGAQAAPSVAAWEHSVVTTAVQQRLQSPESPDAGAAGAAGPSTHAGVRVCPLQGPSGGGACGGSPQDAAATGGSGDGGSEGRGTRAEAEPSCAACEDSADATGVQQPRSAHLPSGTARGTSMRACAPCLPNQPSPASSERQPPCDHPACHPRQACAGEPG